MATALLSQELSPAFPAVPKKARFYRPELDLLRLLAFAMVFFHHAMPVAYALRHPFWSTPLMAASAGMCVFFMLSAYLITELLLREKETTGAVQLRSFYVRRVLRIWPLYYLVLLACVATSRWSGLQPDAFLAFALLGGNWFCYANGWAATGVAAVLWSISIEEQFYLIVPTLFRYGGKRALTISSAGFIVLAYGTLLGLGGQSHLRQQAWTHTLVQFQFFALGTLVALVLHHRTVVIPAVVRPLLALTGLRACCYFSDIAYLGPGTSLMIGFGFLACGVLCLFMSMYGLKVDRWAKPLLYLGRISYGLYVYHFMVIAAVTAVLAQRGQQDSLLAMPAELGLTIAISAVSYRFVEAPFLRLKDRFTLVPSRPAARWEEAQSPMPEPQLA